MQANDECHIFIQLGYYYICVRMYACACVCVHVCVSRVYVCAHMYACMCAHVNAYMHKVSPYTMICIHPLVLLLIYSGC